MLRSWMIQAAPAVARGLMAPRPLCTATKRHQVAKATASTQPDTAASAPPRPVEEIPGPGIYPVIGSLPYMMRNLDSKRFHKFFISLCERYGPICRMVLPGYPPMVIVTDPDDYEKLNHATMADPERRGLESLMKARNMQVDNFFEGKTGLLMEQHEEWWRVRSKVQTPMLKPKKVFLYLEKMDQVSQDFLDRIATMQAELGEMPSNFQVELYKWALESISLIALNRRLGCLDPDLDPAGEQMTIINTTSDTFNAIMVLELGIQWWRLFSTPNMKKLMRCQDILLKTLLPAIGETEEQLKRGGWSGEDVDEMPLLETLLLTPGLSRKDVVTFMLDFFFAGIDTTSHTLGFVLYLLARNPEAQKRLQEEVDGVIGDHTGPLTQHHIGQLTYLKAVIKESLRLFPLTIGIGRTLTKDMVLRGYHIPAGYMVTALTMVSGWQESNFPRAKEFVPERWLRSRPEGPIHPFASLPFGIGTRMCIGRRLAEQEMYALLVRMMQRYTVDYKYEDMDLHTNLVFQPSEPLRFTFTERN